MRSISLLTQAAPTEGAGTRPSSWTGNLSGQGHTDPALLATRLRRMLCVIAGKHQPPGPGAAMPGSRIYRRLMTRRVIARVRGLRAAPYSGPGNAIFRDAAPVPCHGAFCRAFSVKTRSKLPCKGVPKASDWRCNLMKQRAFLEYCRPPQKFLPCAGIRGTRPLPQLPLSGLD